MIDKSRAKNPSYIPMPKATASLKRALILTPVVNKLLSLGLVLAALLVLVGPTGHVFASESNSKRYSDGYNNGYDWYANHPNDGPSNCDPDQLYTSGGGHSQTYCNGWSDGYTAASNGNSNQPSGVNSGQTSSNSGQQQQGSINWEDLCNKYGSLVGIQTPCSDLAHGTQLTKQGQTTLVCLFGGAIGLLSGQINAGNLAQIKALSASICPP